jgi:nucleoside-diphosphate-sugar epimerase
MATAKKIVVCGGNGFLGSRICKSAIARGWDVTSIRLVHTSQIVESVTSTRKRLANKVSTAVPVNQHGNR